MNRLEHLQETVLPVEPRSSSSGSGGSLLRVLGVAFGLAVIIGNTIGAGIFRTPGVVAALLPDTWLFLTVWILGGLYALVGAMSLAELGTMLPRSGGQYVFARYALGDYVGFIVGWSDWISTCGTTAAVALVIGEFTGALFPALSGRSVLIASSVAIIFAVLQWRGILWGSRIQNLTSFIKALAFIALVAACFILGGGASSTATSPALKPMPVGLALFTALVLAIQPVIYTYDGWAGVVYFSEEVHNPGRDIPRSLFGGVLSIIGIYLLVNLALVYVLPVSRIAGQEFAAGVAAEVIFGAHGETIFRTLTVLSMLSCINAYHLMATRVLFAMSRDGLFSRFTARVNEGGTPTVALFMCTAIAVLFIVFGKTFERVITVLAFFFVANYTISFISVFVLRRREPEKTRPYRAWGYPLTTALALLGSVAFLAGAIASDTRNSIYALLLLAASYPAFLLLRRLSRA
ncbi:MAG TPA: APC family permease [Pyrinomonadaceae bacterium]|jgi:APA family basic amino acid/polyamine antiporter